MLTLHDTMSRSLQPVVPLETGHVRVYTCGPTVYARAHIGNFRTFLFEDVLRRVLEQRFARVTHVMNLTDVDDRIIAHATEHHAGLGQETEPWIAAFFEDVEALGIRRAHHYPRATEYIDAMVRLVQQLDRRGVTYRTDGSVYFHIAGFPEYGRLSGAQARELSAGAGGRVDADTYDKEDARDFALWKVAQPGEIGWDTAIGRGRPGWHLECSAMSMTLLGESFDIHCGGVDNIFPHHENEIAQSEAATGHRFVNLWCHSEHLRIDSAKMAKSLGNDFTLADVLREQGERASTVRYLLAATVHYRKILNYAPDSLHASGQQVERFAAFNDRVAALRAPGGQGGEARVLALATRAAFDAAMDDDLNLPEAMGHVFTTIREVNRLLDGGRVDGADRQALLDMIARVDDVLGVLPLVEREREATLSAEDRALLGRRAEARQARDWATSDAIRDQLGSRGILVEDTPDGQRWRPAR